MSALWEANQKTCSYDEGPFRALSSVLCQPIHNGPPRVHALGTVDLDDYYYQIRANVESLGNHHSRLTMVGLEWSAILKRSVAM
jgi:hypothetical protein